MSKYSSGDASNRLNGRIKSLGGGKFNADPKRERAGYIADRMAATDARVDFEQAVQQRAGENWQLVDYATSVLYGVAADGGLAQAFGLEYADAIWWRYLAACKWADVAEALRCSVRTAQTRVQVGMDYIDSNGIEDTRAGIDNLR